MHLQEQRQGTPSPPCLSLFCLSPFLCLSPPLSVSPSLFLCLSPPSSVSLYQARAQQADGRPQSEGPLPEPNPADTVIPDIRPPAPCAIAQCSSLLLCGLCPGGPGGWRWRSRLKPSTSGRCARLRCLNRTVLKHQPFKRQGEAARQQTQWGTGVRGHCVCVKVKP